MIEILAGALALALIVLWSKVIALEKRCALLVKAVEALALC
ncbi:MAG: hypothetical protein SFV19_19460 [Rhodospirillaceae bacterium]|nr:hypothetical protein [Rhodospirillaceae bacterium]